MTTAPALQVAALRFHAFRFKVIAMDGAKRPIVDSWTQYRNREQTAHNVEAMAWDQAKGIAGFGLPCIDIDSATDTRALQTFLTICGLPADYEWVVKTPGKMQPDGSRPPGYHVRIDSPGLDIGKMVEDRPARFGADHIELRTKDVYAMMPGSQHPEGGYYDFLSGQFPVEPPAIVAADLVLAAYDAITVPQAQKQTPQQRTSHSSLNGNGTGHNPFYVKKAIERELDILAGTKSGRNNQLNQSAYTLAGYLWTDVVTETELEDLLYGAAIANGYVAKDGETEARKTIRSGIERGRAKKKNVPAPMTQDLGGAVQMAQDAVDKAKASQPTGAYTNGTGPAAARSNIPLDYTGPAIWRNRDHDEPVVIAGSLPTYNGVAWYSIEGSTTGISGDELDLPEVDAPAQSGGAPTVGTIDPEQPDFQTDLGNGRRFAKQHGHNVRHIKEWGNMIYTGKRWEPDSTGQVMRWAKQTALSIFDEAKVCLKLAQKAQEEVKLAAEADNMEAAKEAEAKADKYAKLSKSLTTWAMKSQGVARLEAMVKLAMSEHPIPARVEDFDKDIWLFNCDNGTVDLRTGRLQPHRREDLITKLCPTPYDAAAQCPLWEKTVTRLMHDKQEMVGFLRRTYGYSLSGDVSEQKLFFPYGDGSNGKTTTMKVPLEIMGKDYATMAAPDLLTSSGTSRHPTEVADLRGMRMVASIEVDDGKRMAEGLVKQLTGGDRVKARFMRQDFFEFEPTHKIFLVANHKPVIRGTDYAIWRRVLLIPFTVKIEEEEKDKNLPEKLRAEYPGILAWMVRGCLEWQEKGLQVPDEVMAATDEYKKESDVLARFLDECTVRVPIDTQASKLFKCYQKWCAENGEEDMNNTRFGLEMTKRGYEKQVQGRNKQTFYLQLGLVDDEADDEGK
jgi:P4 family phage/plasmid primase-like protien